jgi:FixJ family two-component response regulator
MQMGATDYVEKPVSDNEILRIIETHMRPPFLAA